MTTKINLYLGHALPRRARWLRLLGYWLGAGVELLACLHRPLSWRTWQRWRQGLIHARDLLACLAAIALWVAAVIVAGS